MLFLTRTEARTDVRGQTARKHRVWRRNWRDGALLALALAQLGLIAALAWWWPLLSMSGRAAGGAALAIGHWYSIAIVGHLFVHSPWFCSQRANRAAGTLVSLAMGQSAEAYRLSHVRNHHRYSNDRQDGAGRTRDTSSTFRHARKGRHQPLWRYALGGAMRTLIEELGHRVTVVLLWVGGAPEPGLKVLLSRGPERMRAEIRAIRLERSALALSWSTLLALRPGFLAGYLAALALAFALVNIQNYFEHFGARPEDGYANSVSHYGRFYNLLTFNDGHHQEHHLQPGCHWRALPDLRRRHAADLGARARVVSPVPAVVGFLHLRRQRLDLLQAPPPARRT